MLPPWSAAGLPGAASWPDWPIRIIIPFPAGGPTDGRARPEDPGLTLRPGISPAAVDGFIAAEAAKWQGLMRSAGVRAD